MNMKHNIGDMVEGGDNEPGEYVVVEHMPAYYRESHRAAHNWGTYPHNGAERYLMPRKDAEIVVKLDSDGYDRIVRDAAPREDYDFADPDDLD